MNLIGFIILFPLLGFLLLAFSQGRWSDSVNTMIGVGSVGLAALITTWFVIFNQSFASTAILHQYLWTWISVDSFNIVFALSIDRLSLTMLSIITGIGFVIHLYASWYMEGEEGYSRFFAYTNLFIANMALLVLADNLLLLYFGWEGVGLCSYLLIGFYHTETKNNQAAMKAFIITRIGDVLLALALCLLYNYFGTLNIHDIILLAEETTLAHRSQILNWATILILGGAVGKSAQLPLQTWLADAMVGPTPVSALIHAATMVTAGVYLIARTHGLFLLAPDILNLVGLVGAMTLVMACLSALVQTDMKKILAYSTMSQIGYMFLALGTQVWDGAIIHLMTHAIFKSLLFLCSGIVILTYYREHNIFKIGGLRQSLPIIIYIGFFIGCLALSATPLVTSGFFSKEKILCGALTHGYTKLMLVGLLGELLTAIYTFRMFFVLYYGKVKIKAYDLRNTNRSYYLSLVAVTILIVFTFISTWIIPLLTEVMPISNLSYQSKYVRYLDLVSSTVTITGIIIAAIFWLGQYRVINLLTEHTLGRVIFLYLFHAWGFDWLYDKIFIKPYLAIAQLISSDPLNSIMNIPAVLNKWLVLRLKLSFSSKLHWYMISICLGALIVMIILVCSSLLKFT